MTFLFTDIVGSTQRWDQNPDQMREDLARHDALLQRVIAASGGVVFKTVGDAFCAAFSVPGNALSAARSITLGLASQDWIKSSPVHVRQAIHTGSPEVRGADYFGPPLNRVARLLSAGHGGQILLSATTHALVAEHLPMGCGLLDLGSHQLKDLRRPEHIYQLLAQDLSDSFPPLRTVDSLPNNLPTQLTAFVGRETQITEVRSLLSRARLVTIMGTGGAGKTRLAIETGAQSLDDYADGVWLIELAEITDPDLVMESVAAALGVRAESDRPLEEAITHYLRDRHLLLILDNCEHVIGAAAGLAERLIRTCSRLRMLATSREVLAINAETIWSIPPLSLPRFGEAPTVEELNGFESARLFSERAAASSPGFTITDSNAPSLAHICQRLDGIPLALELAAARIRVLTLEQIAARLDNQFKLLTGGSRTAVPRQQTLRALVDWSHDLLSDTEQALFRRLAVFAGGWTLEAAEGVCSGVGLDVDDVLDVMSQLVDKSLVIADEHLGEARFRMLETLRQYGREKLILTGEDEQLQARHRDWFAQFMTRQIALQNGANQDRVFERTDAELGNLRAALDTLELRPGAPSPAIGMANDLVWFTCMRGYIHDEHERLLKLLSTWTEPGESRATLLSAAGKYAHHMGKYDDAMALLGESVSLWRPSGRTRGLAISLCRLGQLEQALGHFESAWSLLDESQSVFREIGVESGLDAPLALFLAQVAMNRGDHEQAIQQFEDCVSQAREIDDRHSTSSALRSLGELLQMQGDISRAAECLRESLTITRDLDDRACSTTTLDSIAMLAGAEGEHERAVCAHVAAATARKTQATSLSPSEESRVRRAREQGEARLSDTDRERACTRGQSMSLADAIDWALNVASSVVRTQPESTPVSGDASVDEVDFNV